MLHEVPGERQRIKAVSTLLTPLAQTGARACLSALALTLRGGGQGLGWDKKRDVNVRPSDLGMLQSGLAGEFFP